MMNDYLINQTGLITPPTSNTCLYRSRSELDNKIGFDCLNVAPERENENKKRIENG